MAKNEFYVFTKSTYKNPGIFRIWRSTAQRARELKQDFDKEYPLNKHTIFKV